MKYPARRQKAEDLPGVVIDPCGDRLDYLGGDLVKVRPFREPAPDHFVQVLVASAFV